MIIDEQDYLQHYGTPRHSGRYPWGSGGNEEGHLPRSASFLDHVNELRRQGMTEAEIAKGMGISTTALRAKKTIANAEKKHADIAMAQRLKDKGYSNTAIGERMGINESSVRALLAPGAADRSDALFATSNMLKARVDEDTWIDIGSGIENHIGVSKERLGAAVAILQEQGYQVHTFKNQQVGTGLDTEYKVLAPPGTTQREAWENRFNLKQPTEMSIDDGHTFGPRFQTPIAINPKRVGVNYKEDGGDKADGVIYVRPGVKDVSLGKNQYAQVRVQIGDGHYLKGMAIYKDDLPPGKDLVFNTNKSSTGNHLDAMKPLKDDPDLPFGSVVSQIFDNPGTPNAKVSSAMNLVNESGDWDKWSRTLSSQMLSKQSPKLAKEQLDVTFERRQREFDELNSLTNPTIKKRLLEKFAESTDSAAVHLKAANLPRQATKVIMPVNTLKPTEIYAPSFRDGERVVLIRYPHGGRFEIPELTVNNRHREAKKLLGDAQDAVGIHHSVAEHLSGADFDGDTVLVIPNNHGKVKISPALQQLKGFDPKTAYPGYEGMPPLSSRRKQQLMGDVSNLITDMSLQQASHNDIARAVRHSMVVIDAEKHNLNHKQSAIDNGIKQLKEQYQGRSNAGASTLISRKKKEIRVPEDKPRPMSEGGPVDPVTGKRVFVETGRTKLLPSGERVARVRKVSLLDRTDDAHTLSSGTPMEKIYADHSNKLKNLANQARLAALNTPRLNYSPSAKKVHEREVRSLDAKLAIAEKNAPRERHAQLLASAQIKAKRDANPDLEKETITKIRAQALAEARVRLGAHKQRIDITQDEWNAIQAGAISNNKLSRILDNADLDRVRELATPRTQLLMSPAMTRRAQSMLANGATRAEVADQLGVSLTTLDTATND